MGEAADPTLAAARGRVAPPLTWRTRLAVLTAGYVTDATRRADGTVNRRLLGVLDKGVAASAAPRHGVASRDVVLDAAVPLRARLFHPAASGSQEEGRRPLPVVVFFHAAAAEAAAGSEKQRAHSCAQLRPARRRGCARQAPVRRG